MKYKPVDIDSLLDNAETINREYEAKRKIESPTFAETLGASFRRDNTVGSFMQSIGQTTFDEDPNFNVGNAIKGTRYDDEYYFEKFQDVKSQKEFDFLSNKIDKEEKDLKIQENSPFINRLVAGLVSTGLDPLNLFPIAGVGYKAYKGGKVARSILKGAEVGAVSEIASETALQSMQETRTLEESAINVSGGLVLGGFIGGAGSMLSKENFNKLSQSLQKDKETLSSLSDTSVGAKQVDADSPEDFLLKGGKINEKLNKAVKNLNPIRYILDGSSTKVKSIAAKLVNIDILLKGKNPRDSVELERELYNVNIANHARKLKELYKKSNFKGSFEKFQEAVGENTFLGREVEDSAMNQATKLFKQEIGDPMGKDLVETGLLKKETIEKRPNYLPYFYNRKKVEDSKEFKPMIEEEIRKKLFPEMKKKYDELGARLEAKRKKLEELEAQKANPKDIANLEKEIEEFQELYRLEDIKLEDIPKDMAEGIHRNITSKYYELDADLFEGIETYKGIVKQRKLDFVDVEKLLPYLDTNITRISNRYVRQAGSDIALKRKFGSVGLQKEIEEIRTEYNLMKQKVKSESKEMRKLNNEERRNIEIIQGFIDILRGHYKTPKKPDGFWVQAGQVMREIQYMSKLGGVTISSIPDMFTAVMSHGMVNTLGKGLIPMITRAKGYKLARKEAELGAAALERDLAQRIHNLADLSHVNYGESKFRKFTGNLTSTFSKFTGINMWNDAFKGMNFVLAQNRIINSLLKLDKTGKINKRELSFLKELGIDENNSLGITNQLKKYSRKDGGFNISGIDSWDNQEAKRMFQTALLGQVNRSIITKSIGDMPLWANTELGRTVLQFKSHAFASLNKLTGRAVQSLDDRRTYEALVSLVGMGMLVQYLKDVAKQKDISTDAKYWFKNGLDRSGLLTILGEFSSIPLMIGNKVGLDVQAPSRYEHKRLFGTMVGPTFGLPFQALEDLYTDNNKNLTRTFVSNIPFQNLFYLRNILEPYTGDKYFGLTNLTD